ncbi:MAG: Phosphoglycerate mutase [Candidatus Woesebacteria bacterium GW2011_GWA2_40_7]|uniref:Phosphoglycerate mutase n=3 Tax=Candidatus Woeseibacteriota TaxID=1752722 RepID=A0A0G0X7K0_9BACT|nr:MAG: Phosphoglycerate mutase [Candidatus Woesebacteria bacterium GW2011_GWB1_39_10]KKR74245.1 MAG: Phosphoglycerate mutase [Candidatus Woesebacteria bacterium GW2011_GWA2_40_7]KKR92620.1 MAG: Phosphoglycerate mutase [Candidatus Woesebacteria bacterium GW2011_GWA1_41_13b]
MAKTYLVRHGESVANTKGIYQGQTFNTPLSDMGKLQAKALAKYFGGVEIRKILASPLLRTKQTAQEVADLKNIEVIDTLDVIETNHSEWEGVNKKIIEEKWPDVYKTWMETPADAKFPKGETFLETQERIINWWEGMTKNEENTLVVTHDNIIRILVAHALGLLLNNIWKFELNPAAVTVIETNGNNQRLIALDEKKHLQNLLVDLKKHAF